MPWTAAALAARGATSGAAGGGSGAGVGRVLFPAGVAASLPAFDLDRCLDDIILLAALVRCACRMPQLWAGVWRACMLAFMTVGLLSCVLCRLALFSLQVCGCGRGRCCVCV